MPKKSRENGLWKAAKKARKFAHAPFSNFKVGAALETDDGEFIGGCNVENATYGLTICAERVAIFKAVSEGKQKFKRVCIVTDTDGPTSPCGACRQLLWEFCGNIEVLMGNRDGILVRTTMGELFPMPFDKKDL
ncbi:MAG: cytidine deaminase [Planctomycetes bacterium]|nr:cytidine deaminase [Planctomycetota bacterium]